jgi:hypothetical protein
MPVQGFKINSVQFILYKDDYLFKEQPQEIFNLFFVFSTN